MIKNNSLSYKLELTLSRTDVCIPHASVHPTCISASFHCQYWITFLARLQQIFNCACFFANTSKVQTAEEKHLKLYGMWKSLRCGAKLILHSVWWPKKNMDRFERYSVVWDSQEMFWKLCAVSNLLGNVKLWLKKKKIDNVDVFLKVFLKKGNFGWKRKNIQCWCFS